MTADDLRSWLDRLDLTTPALARLLGRPERTVRAWIDGPSPLPPEAPLWLCELVRREWERRGLGTMTCPRCSALAVEDDSEDDRYGCVVCGARVDP